MASNVPYIKGVRTRYMNVLKKEIEVGCELLAVDTELVDETEFLLKVNNCVERLQLYCDKVECQTEKLAEAIGDSDIELTGLLVTENETVCDKATECLLDLKHLKETVSMKRIKVSETKEKYGMDQIVELQKQMNDIVLKQMKQQHEFIEKQEQKEKEMSTSVKLPKLDLITFSGDKLKWSEFWDGFETAVHNNKKLSNIEKFNYLRSKLEGEAKSAILGLTLSKENYVVAIEILKERFGDEQKVIDLHYNKMINLLPASSKTSSLRHLLDSMEKHLRSLESLNQNVNQDVFVSMIRAKLPEDVLLQLEILHGTKNKWTVNDLRDRLHEYITAREHAEKKEIQEDLTTKKHNSILTVRRHGGTSMVSRKDTGSQHRPSGKPMVGPIWKGKQGVRNTGHSPLLPGSAEALVVNTKQATTTRYYDQCRYCNSRHWSDECTKYSTIEQRKKQLKDSCYRCLKLGHLSKECKKNKTCVYCGEVNTHHRSLCPKQFGMTMCSAHLSEEFSGLSEKHVRASENVLISSGEIVLMQTALSEIKNKVNSKSSTVRILLDSGSQRTYVTEKLAEQLQLTRENEEEIKLITFGSETPKTIKTRQTKLSLKLKNGQYLEISANIVPVISGTVQRKAMKMSTCENFENLVSSLDLADNIPKESEASSVELLIGNDYYLDIILSQKIEIQPGLYFLASKLGWILTGRTGDPEGGVDQTNMLILTYGTDVTKNSVFTSVDIVNPQKPDLEDFWNVESIGILDNLDTSNDTMVRNKFRETLKFAGGRYQVTWPWKEENPELPVNRELALGRLKSTLNRMKNKPELMTAYDSIIHEQLNKGVIEKVDQKCVDGPIHYLPHHPVINPLKPTTKLRIVYDASSKSRTENKSLNDCLYRGPVLLNDLCGLLMRFRLNQVAVVADIEKAFLQIGLQPTQRDVTRFIWIKDRNQASLKTSNIQEYRFCRVPFGVVASPFLLGATIECHLDLYNSDLAKKLKDDIYVDNLITGGNCTEEVIRLYRGAKSMFNDASMNFREWMSNDSQVNQFIDKEDLAVCDSSKVLGHTWDIDSDSISLKQVNFLSESKNVTKRNVLKEISSMFDPLGLFSPVLLKGKLLLQSLWKKNLEWDDKISESDLEKWLSVKSELHELPKYQVKRCITLYCSSGNVKTYLLCFCDASANAYAAVVYLFQQEESESKVNILFSKTRLAPLKQMTIPRLELMAVLIGTRCLRFIKSQLNIAIDGLFLWTDSQCVIKWITSEKALSVFVRNRVKEITNEGDIVINYVRSEDNPADIASRGSSSRNLSENQLWWYGPTWVMKRVSEWPNSEQEVDESAEKSYRSELKKQKSTQETGLLQQSVSLKNDDATLKSGMCPPFGIDSEQYSSITKLLRVTAYVLRFISRLTNRQFTKGSLSTREIVKAENMWIQFIQKKHFSDVFESIYERKANNLQRQLGLYIDNENLLRCTGRLEHAELTESARRPILLPKNERLTRLIIEQVHRQNLHSGVSQCLSQVRHKYWILQGRATVKSVIKSCLTCRRHEGGPYRLPTMSPLPSKRVKEATPFSRTGLDYLGPLYIRTIDGMKKVWVCLFTCLVIRAIHLELVIDMTTEEFLLALRRFISQRGAPIEFLSDNSLTFKSASKALELIWKNVTNHEEIQSYVSNAGIKWTFIVEMAPWMGGFYERLIGFVKRALRKTIHKNRLTLIQLQTILKEVEATVNTRPLVYVGDDLESNITLSPRHFLTLNPYTGIPENEYDPKDPDYYPYESSSERLLQIWKKGQRILNAFWKVWRDEYLLSLRERMQTTIKSGRIQSQLTPRVGDVVLIKEDLPRGCWRLGKMISLVTSLDGHIRSAKVSLSSGRTIVRPLNLLYPIEASENFECELDRNGLYKDQTSSMRDSHVNDRYERVAAKHAREKIKQLVS